MSVTLKDLIHEGFLALWGAVAKQPLALLTLCLKTDAVKFRDQNRHTHIACI